MVEYSYGDLLKAYYAWTATIDKHGVIKNQFLRNDLWHVYCDVRDSLPAGQSKLRYLAIKIDRTHLRPVLPH